MAGTKRILAGDIGGTKMDLGLFVLEKDRISLLSQKRFLSRNYSSAEEVVSDFIWETGARRLDGACFGVAATVEDGKSRMTNLDWTVSADEMAGRFSIETVRLINDVEATAWGVFLLKEKDLFVLNDRPARPGNACLIAAGTGLGEAPIFWNGSSHVPSPSEGGHADFAPRNEVEIELLRFLMKRYKHVSYERVLSGPGLENIYSFLLERSGSKAPERLKKRFEEEGMAPAIAEAGLGEEDTLCRETLRIFSSIYGAEAGNLALKTLARGGVYVGGGIAPRIIDVLSDGSFMDSFKSKGRFEEFLSNLRVSVIMNEQTALIGAAHYCARDVSPDIKRFTCHRD